MMEFFDLWFALAVLIAGLAGLAKGYAGFGGGMIMTPIFALMYGPVEAVVTTTVLEGLASFQLFPRALPKTDWPIVAPLVIVTAIFTPIGVWALVSADPHLMRRAIGVLVVAFAAITLSGWRYKGGTRPAVTFGVGASAGLLMGGTGLGGPPVLLYMLARDAPVDRIRAGIISYFTIVITVLFGALLWKDAVNEAAAVRTAALVPVFLLATWLGSRLYGGSDDAMFRRIALSFLVIAGLAAIVG